MEPRKSHRSWLIALCGIGLATTGSACMSHSSTKVKDDQLGRLSAADREQLIDQERNVNVAAANVDASKVALDDAKQFRDTAENEVKSAKRSQEQISDQLKIATKAGNKDTAAIQQQVQARSDQVTAAKAKSEYADRLVDLRKAEVENREAEHDLTDAQFQSAQYELLRERGLQGKLDGNKFMERERKAEAEYAETQQTVNEKFASAKASRKSWGALRGAAAGEAVGQPAQTMGEMEPELIEAPQPPDSLQSPPASSTPAQSAKSPGEKAK